MIDIWAAADRLLDAGIPVAFALDDTLAEPPLGALGDSWAYCSADNGDGIGGGYTHPAGDSCDDIIEDYRLDCRDASVGDGSGDGEAEFRSQYGPETGDRGDGRGESPFFSTGGEHRVPY